MTGSERPKSPSVPACAKTFTFYNEGRDPDGAALFRIYVNPLVMWVWIGAWVLTLGTVIAILPDRRDRLRRGRTVGLSAAS